MKKEYTKINETTIGREEIKEINILIEQDKKARLEKMIVDLQVEIEKIDLILAEADKLGIKRKSTLSINEIVV